MEFWADFGAEEEGRLTPVNDNKPKDAEIPPFKASSDYVASANSQTLAKPRKMAVLSKFVISHKNAGCF